MAKTLYVGNLPWSATEQELSETFGAHGQVFSARIVTERETGRSRGFGFVEVEDDAASKIVSAMNGFQLGGRSLIVNEAKPRSERPARSRV